MAYSPFELTEQLLDTMVGEPARRENGSQLSLHAAGENGLLVRDASSSFVVELTYREELIARIGDGDIYQGIQRIARTTFDIGLLKAFRTFKEQGLT